MAVASQFLARCPHIIILGPADFTTIAEWEKQDIPLEFILSSLNELCDGLGEDRIKIESISDVKDRMNQNFIDWLRTASYVYKEKMTQR